MKAYIKAIEYYLPEKIQVINELPKTLMNKIDYKLLENEEDKLKLKVLRKEDSHA